MIDVFALARKRCFHSERLHIDVGLHQSRQMRRYGTDTRRLYTIMVNKTWDFDAATERQICDNVCIRYIAINHALNTCFHTMDNQGAIFYAWLDLIEIHNSFYISIHREWH